MPRNPDKKPCAMPGCKARAKHGHELCASHLTMGVVPGTPDLVVPLLRAIGDQVDAPDLADADVIEQELRQLLSARALFISWLQKARQTELETGKSVVTPVQFLRAWTDSYSRMVALLKARADLRAGAVGVGDGAFSGLLNSIYDQIEALLPYDGRDELDEELLHEPVR